MTAKNMRRLIVLPAIFLLVSGAQLPETAPIPEAGPSATTNKEGRSDKPDGDEDPTVEAKADPAPPPADEAALDVCETELKTLGAQFERRKPIDGEGLCGLAAPYTVAAIAPGVRLTPDTEMSCAAALATSKWVTKAVLPAVEALGPDISLTRITHASTYVCRKRNNQSGGRMSEHALGGAIDISRFDFDGRAPLPIVPRAGKGTIEEAFQRAVRAGACLYFTTVLGPGSDGYHDDHLHFDVIRRPRGYRLCQ
jgi:hypothetical protein